METSENCVENGKLSLNGGMMEFAVGHQYDTMKQSLLNGYDNMADKTFGFEANFNGNGSGSGDEYDENDDGTFSNG